MWVIASRQEPVSEEVTHRVPPASLGLAAVSAMLTRRSTFLGSGLSLRDKRGHKANRNTQFFQGTAQKEEIK